jgi:hypothetical protein
MFNDDNIVSGDGYPYSYVDYKDTPVWPKFDADGGVICTIQYKQCFSNTSITSAGEFFKWIAFENPVYCGDCCECCPSRPKFFCVLTNILIVIHALRAASGDTGLSAFLPDTSRTFESSPSADTWDPQVLPGPPHLPIVSDWRTGKFSLQAVLPKATSTNVRNWSLRLLERYRFVIGDTATRFEMIESGNSAQSLTKKLDRDTRSVSLTASLFFFFPYERVYLTI